MEDNRKKKSRSLTRSGGFSPAAVKEMDGVGRIFEPVIESAAETKGRKDDGDRRGISVKLEKEGREREKMAGNIGARCIR